MTANSTLFRFYQGEYPNNEKEPPSICHCQKVFPRYRKRHANDTISDTSSNLSSDTAALEREQRSLGGAALDDLVYCNSLGLPTKICLLIYETLTPDLPESQINL